MFYLKQIDVITGGPLGTEGPGQVPPLPPLNPDLGSCPRMPRVCGPGQSRRQNVFHWGPSCLCRGARHYENLFL